MSESLATHRTMVLVDVASFTHPDRKLIHHLAVRAGLYKVLQEAFDAARVDWASCHYEDRGDGAMILVPAEVPATVLADQLPERIAAALRDHNAVHAREASIQLRLVLHSGQVEQDANGVAGLALNYAFRLLAAPVAKQHLRNSAGILAVVASEEFYRDVISQKPAAAPESYRRIQAELDGFSSGAWLRLMGQLPGQTLSAPLEVLGQFSDREMDRIRGWLSDVKEPAFADIARRAAGSALPLSRFEDPWHAFVRLTDISAGPDGVPPALVYLDALATQFDGEPGSALAEWVEEKVRQLHIGRAFGEHRRAMPRMGDEPRLHLLIALEHDAIEPNRYVLSVWRQDDPDVWPPARSDILDVDLVDIEQAFDDVVVAAERAWAGQRAAVTLEIFLPRALLNLPVHAWSKEHDSGQPQPLCLDYDIRVRSLDRLRSPHWHRSWRERWHSLQTDPSPARIHFAGENTVRVDVALRDHDSVAMVLSGPPSQRPAESAVDEFTAAIRCGLPVLFWHPEATAEELHELVMVLVSPGGLISLPEQCRKTRRASIGSSALAFAGNLARDLVVLWDDADRQIEIDHPPNSSP